MPNYRIKQILDIKRYEPGMETGFFCFPIGSLNCSFSADKYYSKTEPLPRNQHFPAFMTLNGPVPLHKGDYIVTNKGGDRWVCSEEDFQYNYEPIDEE